MGVELIVAQRLSVFVIESRIQILVYLWTLLEASHTLLTCMSYTWDAVRDGVNSLCGHKTSGSKLFLICIKREVALAPLGKNV